MKEGRTYIHVVPPILGRASLHPADNKGGIVLDFCKYPKRSRWNPLRRRASP